LAAGGGNVNYMLRANSFILHAVGGISLSEEKIILAKICCRAKNGFCSQVPFYMLGSAVFLTGQTIYWLLIEKVGLSC
jgi:hypothetical protein